MLFLCLIDTENQDDVMVCKVVCGNVSCCSSKITAMISNAVCDANLHLKLVVSMSLLFNIIIILSCTCSQGNQLGVNGQLDDPLLQLNNALAIYKLTLGHHTTEFWLFASFKRPIPGGPRCFHKCLCSFQRSLGLIMLWKSECITTDKTQLRYLTCIPLIVALGLL